MQSFEIYSEDLPFKSTEFSFNVACKGHACFWISTVLEIVVTDWKLRVTLFDITFVNNANVAASKNWSLFWIASYRKLSQVQSKSFSHVNRENE